MSASFLGKYRPWNICDFFHSSLSLTRATHISGLSFCSFVGLVRSFLPAIYCLFEEKTHHIFNSRKISHIWITSLIQGLQECQGDVHAWCIKSMPLDDVDQLHSFRNKDNLPSFLPSFLQKTCSTIQTLNRAVSQFLRWFLILILNILILMVIMVIGRGLAQ